MKKSLSHAVARGFVLLSLVGVGQSALAADGIEYGIRWDAVNNRYHVYMMPNTTPVPEVTINPQLTIRVPHATGASRFVVTNVDNTLTPGISWSNSSSVPAPVEDTSSDFLSFTMSPQSAPVNAFQWQAGQEKEVFSFTNSGPCLGVVELLAPGVDMLGGGAYNVGNAFYNTGWNSGNTNAYLGNYTSGADCRVVTPTNNPPSAVADNATVTVGGSVTINVLGNDTDADGDTLVISSFTQGSNGATVTLAGGKLVYTPASGFIGNDTFTYLVSDGKGGTATGSVSVTVTAPPNTSPSATADSASVVQGGSVTIDVLLNDTDPEGDSLSIASATDGDFGTTAIQAGKVVYTADASFTGTDTFTYSVSDGKGGTATGSVSVTVFADTTDTDNDGLPDDVEVALGTDPGKADTDGDGVPDSMEVGNDFTKPKDTDGDGVIDALDSDDDGDGIPSSFEDKNSDGDGNPATSPVDTDGDGIPNYLDGDDDGDGIPSRNEDPNLDGDNNPASNPVDTDGDSIPDVLDNDDDNDGLLTIYENYNGGTALNDDTDGDGKPDYRDTDDDGDDIPTFEEMPDPNKNGSPDDALDSDKDGLPDYLDTIDSPPVGGPDADKNRVAIPTMSEWAQILLTILLGIAGFRQLIYRKIG